MSTRRRRAECRRCKRTGALSYGLCITCYESAVKVHGELKLLVEDANHRASFGEKYVHSAFDKTHAHFYELHETGTRGAFIARTDSRQWCLEVSYPEGFPCPPVVKFVNPYDYTDTNPIWWPKSKIRMDPVRQQIDIPFLHPKTTLRYKDVKPSVKRWTPTYVVQMLAPKIGHKI